MKLIKLLLGILLLPTTYAVSRTFLGQLLDPDNLDRISRNTAWFIGGFGIWFVLFMLFPKPMRTYVLGHELTHAMWGLLMGAKVSRLRVSGKGGSVTLNKTNTLITLAPYFFPFYTVTAVATYSLVEIWWDTSPYLPFWYAVFGLTWAFHLSFTVMILTIRQPDIHEHGRIFSYALIYVLNILTAALLLNLLTDRSLARFGDELRLELLSAYRASADLVRPALDHIPWKWPPGN